MAPTMNDCGETVETTARNRSLRSVCLWSWAAWRGLSAADTTAMARIANAVLSCDEWDAMATARGIAI